ncbi:hypothetical protein Patl1_36947 [Pistacia atlantica]|nr:hypothetical protein Patl1_36947 [Pistacia atlantica]
MISNETGQIVITNIVCNMLRTVMDTTPEDLVAVVYLVANKIAPAHVGLILEYSSNVKHFVAKELDIDILVFNSTFQFIFSTAVDGKIKAWPYDNMGSRVDYDAPGLWCTTMLYSADGSRLFSCGTSKDGDSFLVEWNESEGAIKRSYIGFRKKSAGVVQFDTTRNRFLAAGEDKQIKFWDMDNTNVLTSTEAEGGLPSLPWLRFNREGNLLIVTTAGNGLKMQMLMVSSSAVVTSISPVISKVECVDKSSPVRPTPIINGVESIATGIEKPRNVEEVADEAKPWELTEIVNLVQCRAVTMPEGTDSACKAARLLYTNSGVGILALASNGVQKLWKWGSSEQNPGGKHPSNGLLMANDVPENSEEAVPCIALSKNDSYVMSACGGKVSLFNMMNSKLLIM